MNHQQVYWNGVANTWLQDQPHQLWRAFTDRLQHDLLVRGLNAPLPPSAAPTPAHHGPLSILKTDLFDEVAGRGLAPSIIASGAHLTGIDLSPVIVASAAARFPELTAVTADVRKLPFPDGSFDAVFSGSTLDHFDSAADITIALTELRRILRPHGRLILTLDNLANPLIRLRNGPLLGAWSRLGIIPYRMGVTLRPHTLADTVRTAGFSVISMHAALHCPRAIAVALAALLDRWSPSSGESFLRWLLRWEWFNRLPSRWLTGYYTAIIALPSSP